MGTSGEQDQSRAAGRSLRVAISGKMKNSDSRLSIITVFCDRSESVYTSRGSQTALYYLSSSGGQYAEALTYCRN